MSSRLHASQFCLRQRNFGRAQGIRATQQRCRASSELLPIFPLGMVALPASQCPLHIFGTLPRLRWSFCLFVGGLWRSRATAPDDRVHTSPLPLGQPGTSETPETSETSETSETPGQDAAHLRYRSTSRYRGTLSGAVQHAIGRGCDDRSGFGGGRQAMEGDSSVRYGVLRPAGGRSGVDWDGVGDSGALDDGRWADAD